MIVILDNIRSVLNVGSVFRTADALGVEKIYLVGISPTPLDRFGKIRRDFHKTALGAESSVAYEYVASSTELIRKLKKDGYRIVTIEQHKRSAPYYTLRTTKYPLDKLALVFGNELKGVSDKLIKKADSIIDIPMRGMKESLNVAVAFAIVGFHILYNAK